VPPEGLSDAEVRAWLEAFGVEEATPDASESKQADQRKPQPEDDDDPFNIPGVWPPW
jgi:hypothetical protein